MKRCLWAICFLLLALSSISSLRAAEAAPPHWAYWRGPSGQGYSDDTKVPLTWSDKENLLWKTQLPGLGNSSPIVWGDRIFLTASSKDGDERYVMCVRASDGKLLWQQTASKGVAAGKTHGLNGYASASCATDGTYVYAFFGTPGLFCYDFEGKLVWKHTFGIFTSSAGWGTSASPFLYEDLVIQNCDNDGVAGLPKDAKPEDAAPMALVALEKATGKIRWQTPRDQGRGFSTPRLIATPSGRSDLVLNGPLGVWAYDPRTGKELWHCERTDPKDQARFGEQIPVSNADTLFAPSGRPGPLQAIRLGGTGDVTKTHRVWEVQRTGHRDIASPILWGDYLYAIDKGAMLTCLEAKTGNVVYNQRLGTGRAGAMASPVAVRGKLLFLLDEGTTVVVEPGPTLTVSARNKLGDGEEFGASAAIVEGRLYLRSHTNLYCIGEKK